MRTLESSETIPSKLRARVHDPFDRGKRHHELDGALVAVCNLLCVYPIGNRHQYFRDHTKRRAQQARRRAAIQEVDGVLCINPGAIASYTQPSYCYLVLHDGKYSNRHPLHGNVLLRFLDPYPRKQRGKRSKLRARVHDPFDRGKRHHEINPGAIASYTQPSYCYLVLHDGKPTATIVNL